MLQPFLAQDDKSDFLMGHSLPTPVLELIKLEDDMREYSA